MIVRLFDVHNAVIVPTEHCYTLRTLKVIMDEYANDYLNIYAYIFYMTCPNPSLNPFFNINVEEKEDLIRREVGGEFDPDDYLIKEAIAFCHKLYETPTSRAYQGIQSVLDKLATYMTRTQIEHGRDGNITAVVNAAAKFQAIRESFRGAYKDLMEEQSQTSVS